MAGERLNWIEACERARAIISDSPDMERLYGRAVQFHGEGELRHGIMALASDLLQDEEIRDEVFLSNNGLLSFFCGIWIQFLLTEIAGLRKADLRTIAMKVLAGAHGRNPLH